MEKAFTLNIGMGVERWPPGKAGGTISMEREHNQPLPRSSGRRDGRSLLVGIVLGLTYIMNEESVKNCTCSHIGMMDDADIDISCESRLHFS